MANYVVSDASLTSVADAIRAKGGTNAALAYPAEFVSAIGAIPGVGTPVPRKDVNFYDYDGTVVASYTASEFAALSALPANPTHTGLTAQGWNWTLANAKTYVASCGKLEIGQMYITTSGKTEIDVQLFEGRSLLPTIQLVNLGTVVVDWGDGSDPITWEGGSNPVITTRSHSYSAPGQYTISIDVTGGTIRFANRTRGRIFCESYNSTEENSLFLDAVTAVRFGSGVSGITDNAFEQCLCLESITLPHGMTEIGTYAFSKCSKLKCVIFPDTFTTIGGTYAFISCSSLEAVSFPNGMTSIGTGAFSTASALETVTLPQGLSTINYQAFNNCYSLKSIVLPSSLQTYTSAMTGYCYSLPKLTIPADITTIEAGAFGNAASLKELHFLPATPPTISNKSAWSNLKSGANGCKIYVPSASLSAYKNATNYPPSTYTYIGE